MKLLQIVTSLDPRSGGVAEGVLQSSIACLELGHDVEILCIDAPGEHFLKDSGLTVHAMGPGRTGFAYSSRLLPWLREHGYEYNALIVHGLWQFPGFATRKALSKLSIPYFVFTHGMLDPWFKRTYPLKHLKKWVYWPWGDYRVLRDARAVIFTCEEERILARESFWLYKAKEAVASFGTQEPPPDHAGSMRSDFLKSFPELNEKRILLFLGRLHTKKGCDILIDAFSRVANCDATLHLVLAGPDDTGWQRDLESLVMERSLEGRVTFPGMLRGRLKWGAFYASELHVLASHQENFGIVVAEALGCGIPVIITDKVNIWREVEHDNAGLISPDTVDGITRSLMRWLSLDSAQRTAMKRAARNSFELRFTIKAMARSLISIIEPAIRRP